MLLCYMRLLFGFNDAVIESHMKIFQYDNGKSVSASMKKTQIDWKEEMGDVEKKNWNGNILQSCFVCILPFWLHWSLDILKWGFFPVFIFVFTWFDFEIVRKWDKFPWPCWLCVEFCLFFRRSQNTYKIQNTQKQENTNCIFIQSRETSSMYILAMKLKWDLKKE